MKNKNSVKGVATIWLMVLGFTLIIGGGYWFWIDDIKPRLEKEHEPVFCTQDAKECPDGSYVSRTGPNCEFAPCSKSNNEQQLDDVLFGDEARKYCGPEPPAQCGEGLRLGCKIGDKQWGCFAYADTTNWKTYRNEEYGFEIKYPPDWSSQTSTFSITLKPPDAESFYDQIHILAINYDETPPMGVFYSYNVFRNVVIANGNSVEVKKRSPGNIMEKYIAEIKRGNITVEFRFYADRKYDEIFDQILSTFRFFGRE